MKTAEYASELEKRFKMREPIRALEMRANEKLGKLIWFTIISFTFTVADNLSKRDNIDFISE